jgi:hypothetical protein
MRKRTTSGRRGSTSLDQSQPSTRATDVLPQCGPPTKQQIWPMNRRQDWRKYHRSRPVFYVHPRRVTGKAPSLEEETCHLGGMWYNILVGMLWGAYGQTFDGERGSPRVRVSS